MKGLLVCFEGIDGAGKRTQAELLGKWLQQEGFATKNYSYPDYEGVYGKIIRDYLNKKIEMGVGEFFFLQMLDKVKDAIRITGERNAGMVVIADRYVDSQVAYQSAGGFNYEAAKKIIGLSGMPVPDIVFYIDVTIEISMKRKASQKGDLDRHESFAAYLKKVKEYYDMIYKEKHNTWVKIDSAKDIDSVHEEVVAAVEKLLDRKGGK